MSEHTDKNNTNDQLESDQLEIGIDFKRVKEIVLKYKKPPFFSTSHLQNLKNNCVH